MRFGERIDMGSTRLTERGLRVTGARWQQRSGKRERVNGRKVDMPLLGRQGTERRRGCVGEEEREGESEKEGG